MHLRGVSHTGAGEFAMSVQNHYETLGVDESSSFDEIQDARDRLLDEFASDRKHKEAIEAAYDAILMERLRMRQEGKIKVPDRIRFPERLTESPKQSVANQTKKAPEWLSRFMDNPNRNDVLLPAGVFFGAGVLSVMSGSVGLALGVIASLFFINRKENKFLRALLLTMAALALGVAVGVTLEPLMSSQLRAINLDLPAFIGIVTSFFFWLVSSFLR